MPWVANGMARVRVPCTLPPAASPSCPSPPHCCHRSLQGMAEVLAYPAFLPTDCPDRAVMLLPPAAHRLVPPPAAPSAPAAPTQPAAPQAAPGAAPQAAPGTATAAAGGAVVSGGLARSVAEAAADADVGEGGEASGLTSGDGMDTWGGVEGLGFLHGSPYTAGGGTCVHGAGGLGGGRSRAAGGAGRAPPLQPFSLPLHGTLLQSSLALGGRSRAQPVRVHGGGGGGGSTTAAAAAAAAAVAAGGAGAASPPAGAAAVTTAAAAAAATAAVAAIARLPDHVLYGGQDGLYGSAPAKTGPAGPLAAVSPGRGLELPGAPPAAAARHRRVSDAAAAAAAMSHADVALLPGAPQFVMVGVLRDPAAPPPPPVPLLRAASAAGGSSGGGRDAAAAAVAASAAAATGGRFALYLSVSESLRKDLVRVSEARLPHWCA